MSPDQRSQQGIMLVVVAVAFFAAVDTMSKYVSTLVPLAVAIWVRFVIQTAAAGAVLLRTGGRRALKTRHPWLQALRGVMSVASSALGFIALQTLPVADFTAIVMLIPMLITLLSATRFMERVPPRVWLLLLGGLAGALIVIRPGASHFQWGMLFSLGVVAISAVFQLLTSFLVQHDDPAAVHFYTGIVAAILATLVLPFFWAPPDSLGLWFVMVMIGLCSTIGHYFLILAYARAKPSALTPYLYFQIAFAVIAGWLIFSHTPDRIAVIGIVVITLCGLASTVFPVRKESKVLPSETVY